MAVNVPQDFRELALLGRDVEAVIQRCGLHTWDCVIIDVEGAWTRAVFVSQEAAREACRNLELRAHDGWDDPRLARRMNRYDPWSRPDGRLRAV